MKNIYLVSCKCGPHIFDDKPGNDRYIKVRTHDGRDVDSPEKAIAHVKKVVKHVWPDGTEEACTDVEFVDGPVDETDPRVTPSTTMQALGVAPKIKAS